MCVCERERCTAVALTWICSNMCILVKMILECPVTFKVSYSHSGLHIPFYVDGKSIEALFIIFILHNFYFMSTSGTLESVCEHTHICTS